VKRALVVLLVLIGALIVLPPLWYAVFPGDPPPELPPAGRRVELPGGVGVNVVEQGTGPPVVLVHGLPGTAYDWRELSPELAKRGRRAIAYDRVGWGGPTLEPTKPTLRRRTPPSWSRCSPVSACEMRRWWAGPTGA
jgi:pimeloyl-ACP methyl ester carboxylesterase